MGIAGVFMQSRQAHLRCGIGTEKTSVDLHKVTSGYVEGILSAGYIVKHFIS